MYVRRLLLMERKNFIKENVKCGYQRVLQDNNNNMKGGSPGKLVNHRLMRYETVGSTKSSFRSKQVEEEKFKINNLRKNLSLSIKYSTQRSSQSPQKIQQSLPRQQSFSLNHQKPRLNISNLISTKPVPSIIPETFCSSMCAVLSDSNEIFISKNCDQKRQIASLTKIMTAFTVINICNTYGLKIRETTVTVEKQASLMQGTSANLRNGDRFYVIDLLYGLLLPSGNDAALALAQYFGKFLSFVYSTQKCLVKEKNLNQFEELKSFYDNQYGQESIKLFVFEMNKNCFKMKLKNTKFTNPTGLSDTGNYSTASDLTKLISFCLKNHLLRLIFKKKIYTCTTVNQKLGLQRQIQWKNTNKHLFQIRDCIGVKTGITPSAGPCLSSAYKIRGRELIIVILNSRSMEDRYYDAQKIYKYVRSKFNQQQNH